MDAVLVNIQLQNHKRSNVESKSLVLGFMKFNKDKPH